MYDKIVFHKLKNKSVTVTFCLIGMSCKAVCCILVINDNGQVIVTFLNMLLPEEKTRFLYATVAVYLYAAAICWHYWSKSETIESPRQEGEM